MRAQANTKPRPFLHTSSSLSALDSKAVNRVLLNITELLFYGHIFYTNFAAQFNLDIPNLGALWLALLAGMSVFIQESAPRRKGHLYLLALTGVSYLAVQILVFDISLDHQYVKPFLFMIFTALVVDKLLIRPGFLKRLVLVMGVQVLLAWPTVVWDVAGKGMFRARAEGTSFANPNNFGAWQGFCVMGLWLWGIQSLDRRRKWLLWGAAGMFLILMLQTITRGALLAVTAGILVSLFRIKISHQVRLIIILVVAMLVGLQTLTLQENVENYQQRGLEETGRLRAIPVAIDAIIAEPWVGHGAEKVALDLPDGNRMPPHNGFLFLWVAGGILPAMFFGILSGWALLRGYRWSKAPGGQFLDPLPLLVFTLIEIMVLDLVMTHFYASAVFFAAFHQNDRSS